MPGHNCARPILFLALKVSMFLKKSLLAIFMLAAVLSFMAWRHYFPVTAAAGWAVKTHLDDLPLVSALAWGENGALFISLEHGKQRGVLLKRMPDGPLQEVLGGLNKPDGLAHFRGGVLVSQEGGEHPVLWVREGQAEPLFAGKNIEGIAADTNYVYAIEDRPEGGRLWRYDPASRGAEVLRSGLAVGEGLAVCPDGRLFYSEKKQGWIKLYRPAADSDPIVHAGLNAPGYLMCGQEGLWITEDATHGARLLLMEAGGKLRVILEHLRSGQAILAIAPGRLLIAEQGRGRILEINRIPSSNQQP